MKIFLVYILLATLSMSQANGQSLDKIIIQLKDSTSAIDGNTIKILETKNGWNMQCIYCPAWDSVTHFRPTANDKQRFLFFNQNRFLLKGFYNADVYEVNGTYRLKKDSILIRYKGSDIANPKDTICDYRILKLNNKRLIVEYAYDPVPVHGKVDWKICPRSRILFLKNE